MQNTITSPALTDLQAAVLRTVVYSDLFDFPLTSQEVHRWLPVPATLEDATAALGAQPLASLLCVVPPYVTLQGRGALVAVRERRHASSTVLRRQAGRYGRLIGRLPFVRMVALTGSLAVDNADAGDDIDFLIVTAPGRVWTVRTMVMAVGRMASLRGVTLCPNYLLSESALALPQRDFYTARELLQMQPIAGHATYERMLAANAWWREHLPNARPLPETPSPREERGSRDSDGNPVFVRPELVEGRELKTSVDLEAGGETPHPPTPSPISERGRQAEWDDADPVGPELDEGHEGTYSPSPRRGRGPGGGDPPRIIEALIRLPPFDALERWILARKGAELRRQAGGAEAAFDETMCKGHFDAWRGRTQDRLEARLNELRLKLQVSHEDGP